MLLTLKNVLARDQIEGARAMLRDVEFRDGKVSAGMAASRVKHNLEADRSAAIVAKVDSLVMGALVRHPEYRAGALPLKVAAPFTRATPPACATANTSMTRSWAAKTGSTAPTSPSPSS